MGLADLLEIADLHCRKVESTKWLKLARGSVLNSMYRSGLVDTLVTHANTGLELEI